MSRKNSLNNLDHYLHQHCNPIILTPYPVYVPSLLSSKPPFFKLKHIRVIGVCLTFHFSLGVCFMTLTRTCIKLIMLFAVNFHIQYFVMIFHKLLFICSIPQDIL